MKSINPFFEDYVFQTIVELTIPLTSRYTYQNSRLMDQNFSSGECLQTKILNQFLAFQDKTKIALYFNRLPCLALASRRERHCFGASVNH